MPIPQSPEELSPDERAEVVRFTAQTYAQIDAALMGRATRGLLGRLNGDQRVKAYAFPGELDIGSEKKRT